MRRSVPGRALSDPGDARLDGGPDPHGGRGRGSSDVHPDRVRSGSVRALAVDFRRGEGEGVEPDSASRLPAASAGGAVGQLWWALVAGPRRAIASRSHGCRERDASGFLRGQARVGGSGAPAGGVGWSAGPGSPGRRLGPLLGAGRGEPESGRIGLGVLVLLLLDRSPRRRLRGGRQLVGESRRLVLGVPDRRCRAARSRRYSSIVAPAESAARCSNGVSSARMTSVMVRSSAYDRDSALGREPALSFSGSFPDVLDDVGRLGLAPSRRRLLISPSHTKRASTSSA